MTLDGQTILVVGGTSGIGFGVAQMAQDQGAAVTIASRSQSKVDNALSKLGAKAQGMTLDTGDASALEAHFQAHGPYDHIFCSAASTKVDAVRKLPLDNAYGSFDSKFWGAYRLARFAKIKGRWLADIDIGLPLNPSQGCARPFKAPSTPLWKGLTRGLALEFAPVRVNCVSPGLVMTEMYDTLEGDGRKAMFEGAAQKLPVGLVGIPQHIAIQALAFMTNPYMTGQTVFVEGGGAIA